MEDIRKEYIVCIGENADCVHTGIFASSPEEAITYVRETHKTSNELMYLAVEMSAFKKYCIETVVNEVKD